MATSDTAIANAALGHVGNGSQIAVMTEKSNEARACLLYYEEARDKVLGEFPWPFATRIATLALVETSPTSDWGYSYRYPSEALTVRILPSGFDRVAARGSPWGIPCNDWPFGYPTIPIPFRIVSDATGKLIYTDQADATVEYTVRETDPTKFDASFTEALEYLLASKIAPMVTGGDPFKLGPAAYQKYQVALSDARSRAANEEGRDPPPQSEFIATRF